MYTLFKNTGIKKVLTGELPSFGLSLIAAELFYKFGSFILECGAFMATWYVMSFLMNNIFAIKAKKDRIPDAVKSS